MSEPLASRRPRGSPADPRPKSSIPQLVCATPPPRPRVRGCGLSVKGEEGTHTRHPRGLCGLGALSPLTPPGVERSGAPQGRRRSCPSGDRRPHPSFVSDRPLPPSRKGRPRTPARQSVSFTEGLRPAPPFTPPPRRLPTSLRRLPAPPGSGPRPGWVRRAVSVRGLGRRGSGCSRRRPRRWVSERGEGRRRKPRRVRGGETRSRLRCGGGGGVRS